MNCALTIRELEVEKERERKYREWLLESMSSEDFVAKLYGGAAACGKTPRLRRRKRKRELA